MYSSLLQRWNKQEFLNLFKKLLIQLCICPVCSDSHLIEYKCCLLETVKKWRCVYFLWLLLWYRRQLGDSMQTESSLSIAQKSWRAERAHGAIDFSENSKIAVLPALFYYFLRKWKIVKFQSLCSPFRNTFLLIYIYMFILYFCIFILFVLYLYIIFISLSIVLYYYFIIICIFKETCCKISQDKYLLWSS